MNKEDMYWNKGYWDEEDEPSLEKSLPRINVSKVYDRMDRLGLDVATLAKRVGMSRPLTQLSLELEIFPDDKIDILASSLSIDKGELFL